MHYLVSFTSSIYLYIFTGGYDIDFCVISPGEDGVDPLIRNPGTNENLPFREQFQIMDVYFEHDSGSTYDLLAPVSVVVYATAVYFKHF